MTHQECASQINPKPPLLPLVGLCRKHLTGTPAGSIEEHMQATVGGNRLGHGSLLKNRQNTLTAPLRACVRLIARGFLVDPVPDAETSRPKSLDIEGQPRKEWLS
jgi:hypothetical protein